jgi:hypothetical protein
MANRERLEHLKTIARNISPDAIYMQDWFRNVDLDNPTACGTQACLGGYAALDPVFNSQGLTAGVDEDDPTEIRLLLNGSHLDDDSFRVLQDFFGITEMQSYHLFMRRYYSLAGGTQPTNQDLLDHIQHVIEGQFQ